VNMKTNDYWKSQLYNSLFMNEKLDDILNYTKKIDKLTVDAIQSLSKKYLNTDNLVRCVLYPEK